MDVKQTTERLPVWRADAEWPDETEVVRATDYDAKVAELQSALANMQAQRDRIAENLRFERELKGGYPFNPTEAQWGGLARAALSAPSHGGGVAHTDCRAEDGITVGLIDSIITSCRVLSSRDLTCEAAVEALRDLRSDSDVSLIKPSHGEQVRDNRAKFKREERYMVVKLSKLADDLGDDELSREEQIYRLAHFGKALVECVVVESDWPEYEPTWAAIKARVTGSASNKQLPGGWSAEQTDDGEGFIVSSPRINGVSSHFSVFPDSKDYASCALWKMLAAAPPAGSQEQGE